MTFPHGTTVFQVQHALSPRRSNNNSSNSNTASSAAGGGGIGESFSTREASDWSGVVHSARTGVARFASPLASSRWQVGVCGLAQKHAGSVLYLGLGGVGVVGVGIVVGVVMILSFLLLAVFLARMPLYC